jgi:TRAP-type C4-dicarboxylate transport system permease large subunit
MERDMTAAVEELRQALPTGRLLTGADIPARNLDAGPALPLLAPFLLPVTRLMGIDDIHFSMVMIVSCTLGLISPPVGICLFVACKIGNITLRQLWSELRWFFYAQIGVIMILVYFPVLSTGLPRMICG